MAPAKKSTARSNPTCWFASYPETADAVAIAADAAVVEHGASEPVVEHVAGLGRVAELHASVELVVVASAAFVADAEPPSLRGYSDRSAFPVLVPHGSA